MRTVFRQPLIPTFRISELFVEKRYNIINIGLRADIFTHFLVLVLVFPES